MATLQLHRNGILALLGIVLLVALAGAVWTVALLRVISVAVVIVVFIEIVVNLVRHRESPMRSRLFSATFGAMSNPKK